MATFHGTLGSKIAKTEAVIEVLGVQIARTLDVQRKANPDRQKIDESTARIRELRDLQ